MSIHGKWMVFISFILIALMFGVPEFGYETSLTRTWEPYGVMFGNWWIPFFCAYVIISLAFEKNDG